MFKIFHGSGISGKKKLWPFYFCIDPIERKSGKENIYDIIIEGLPGSLKYPKIYNFSHFDL